MNEEGIVDRLMAASRDERLSTGMLYREAANRIEHLHAENAVLKAQLAEVEREQDTLFAVIRHQRDVLRECLPYLNESMADRRPGRCADDIRAAVNALTADQETAP